MALDRRGGPCYTSKKVLPFEVLPLTVPEP
jgi:hypothetical protein